MKYYLLKLINDDCPIDMYDLGFRHSISDSVGHSCGDGCDVIVCPIDSCVDSLAITKYSSSHSDFERWCEDYWDSLNICERAELFLNSGKKFSSCVVML